jgi:GDP-4-dehydro-6-deoxy-D-mannose reductase
MPGPTIVTGAAGFAGRHLLELLARSSADLIAWHRPGHEPPAGVSAVRWQAVDLLDRQGVRRAIDEARPAAVYHCAGAAHVGRSWDATASTLATNVRGTHNLLQALQLYAGDARVLIPSSAMIYQPATEALTEDHPTVPPNPYGFSKLAQELLGRRASNAGLHVTTGRAFNHVGPGQDPSFAASGFARQIAEIEEGRRHPEVVVGNLDARRDTIDVRDTVRAYQTILERGRSGRVYNVCSGRAVAVSDLLEMLRARARVAIPIRVDPARFRPNDVPILVGAPRRLQTELGWAPAIPLERTLDDLLAYWRDVLKKETAAPA